jgi:hypothetical protein
VVFGMIVGSFQSAFQAPSPETFFCLS